MPVKVATRSKKQTAFILAVVSTCVFGRLSVVATAGAFENVSPTTFEQLAWLWNLLRWSVPALFIGTLFARRVTLVAAAVSLIGGFVLLAVDFCSFAPSGSYLPNSIFFRGAATELGTNVIVAVVAAAVVRTGYRWNAIRSTQRQ
jgi:hypothetical protein